MLSIFNIVAVVTAIPSPCFILGLRQVAPDEFMMPAMRRIHVLHGLRYCSRCLTGVRACLLFLPKFATIPALAQGSVTQSSTRSPGTRSNSRRLLVTITSPRERAWMKSAVTAGESNQLSQSSPAGAMMLVRPSAITSTRFTSSGRATALGRRIAWPCLL